MYSYYDIFIDLDGVMVNFEKKLRDLGYSPELIKRDPHKDEFWSFIDKSTREGMKFWSDMLPMNDAFVLWDFVKNYSPTILTSTGGVDAGCSQKNEWVNKYLGYYPVVCVNSSEEKANYAHENAILIDDRSKSILPWESAGGIGILHKNAENSIAQLKDILGDAN
jgi:hypothetical protein